MKPQEPCPICDQIGFIGMMRCDVRIHSAYILGERAATERIISWLRGLKHTTSPHEYGPLLDATKSIIDAMAQALEAGEHLNNQTPDDGAKDK